MITRFLVAAVLALIVNSSLWAQEKQPEGVVITDEFAIFPITTDLQRELINNGGASIYVFINSTAFRGEEKIDRLHPVFEELQKKIAEFAIGDNPGVAFNCREGSFEGENGDERKVRLETLSKVCEEVAYYAGFLNVKTSQTYLGGEFDWHPWINAAKSAAKNSDSQPEEVTGNERVQVFFVHSFLSRLLANADCVVTILPVVRTAGSFPDDFLPDLEKYLLPEKGDKLREAMHLEVEFAPSLEQEFEDWIEDLDGRREFARKLGFEGCNVSHGPTSRPDRLTQGPASRLQIKVKVLDPDGKIIANPQIKPRTYPNVEVQTVPSPDGTVFKIGGRPRDVSFSIIMPGFAPYIARWDASEHPESLPTEFTAKLGKAWTIGGIVVDDQGKPIPYAQVHLSIEYQKRPGDTQQFGTGSELTTDEEGRWSFASVPDTDMEVNAEIHHPEVMPGWNKLARSVYEVLKGEEPKAEIKISRGISFSGRVVDDAGKPITGARVRTRFSNVDREATTDEEGQFEISGCRAGIARMVISAPGKAMMLEEVEVAPDMKPASFTMHPGGYLKIRVLDPQGDPSPGARIFLQEWKGRVQYFEFDHVNTYADENGVWEWKEAPLDEFVADISPRQGMQLPRQKLKAREEEYVFKLNPMLEISGTVVDAETKQPITKFRVVPGRAYSNRESFWNENDAFDVTDGKFSQKITSPDEGHLVRIEADGYKPSISRTFKPTEGAVTVTVDLHKGKNVEATVLKPDGEPALEAVAYLGRPGSQIMLENGHIREEQTYAPKLSLDAVGKISFMEEVGPLEIVIVDDSGFANVKSSDGPVPAEIKLQPWAKVKGVFMVGSKPMANKVLELSTEALNSMDQNGPRIFASYYLTTDNQGRFEGDRIYPGKARLGRRIVRMVDTGATEVTSSMRMRLDLKAGETTEVKFGGTGRPVVGQLLAVEASTEEPNWRLASIHVTTGKSVKPPKALEEVRTPEERTKWWQEWIKTDAGKIWQKQSEEYRKIRDSSPRFNVSVDRDGKFYIDDMPEGEYELSLYFGEQYAEIVNNYQFTVPPMEGERSDEPFDLGEIQLEDSSQR